MDGWNRCNVEAYRCPVDLSEVEKQMLQEEQEIQRAYEIRGLKYFFQFWLMVVSIYLVYCYLV
jgi:hypothetical protein